MGGAETAPTSSSTAPGCCAFRLRASPPPNTHGTGCTLSAAIAAGLAKGLPLRKAKEYLHDALAAGIALCVGKGSGPVHHFHRWWRA